MPYPMSENGRRDNKRHHLHKAKGPQVQIPVELAEESLSGKQILDIVNPGLNRLQPLIQRLRVFLESA